MKSYVDKSEFIFNTRVEQKILTDGIDTEYIMKEASSIMKNFENKLSFYSTNSEVNKINENAGKTFTNVSDITFEIIKESKYYSKITDGLFDITIAPLVKTWKINQSNVCIPKNEDLKIATSLINYEDIILDEVNKGVMLKGKNQKIDLGGIAKGYIADKIIEFYKENKIKSAMINIGGNVKILGRKDENPWNIGIYEPKKHSNEIVCSVELEDVSIVTSGLYERALIYDGKLYHNILNPYTGYPAETDLKSITIIDENSMKCDALSTPLFIMGKYKAFDFMKKNNLMGVMITKDDEVIINKDLIDKFNIIKESNVLSF